MKRSPYRPDNDFVSSENKRPAIFGLETEYVVLYVPDDPEDPRKPPFSLVQEVLFSILLAARKAGLSGGIKRGYFLENGGLIHFEIYLRHQGDTPILEASTPECRSPWDLLIYSRAFDHLLTEIGHKTRAALEKEGYKGHIAFGKNNRDSYGIGYGTHENYLVHLTCTMVERIVYFLCLPPFLLCLIPFVAVLVVVFVPTFLFLVSTWLFPIVRATSRKLYHGLRAKEKLWQNLIAVYHLGSNFLLFPAIWIYTNVLRLLAFRPLTRDLASFLVSRQIFAGTGTLNFAKRTYEISQRAQLTSSVSNIIMFGRTKTLFDLKSLLYEPLSLFKPTKKLTITSGDSNLSDVPNLLKIGTTALLIEMIENGERFPELRLRKPIAAFRRISLEGPWKQLRLKKGGSMSGIEIQRKYLSRAKEYYADLPDGRLRHAQLFSLWEEILERLADKPHSLAESVDWIAKKSLLDGAILPQSSWKKFFDWGSIFHLAGLDATASATNTEELVDQTPGRRRSAVAKALKELGLDPQQFAARRELYFTASKIDLRYHELGHSEGYQRQMEGEGLIQRLSLDEDIEAATREPPSDTRARVRGYYIRLSSRPESIHANWNEIELTSPFRHISLSDPFFHRLPGDE